jgi:hypothetical protein
MKKTLATDSIYKIFINYLNYNNFNYDNIIKGDYDYESLSNLLSFKGYENTDKLIEDCTFRYISTDFYHRNILNPHIKSIPNGYKSEVNNSNLTLKVSDVIEINFTDLTIDLEIFKTFLIVLEKHNISYNDIIEGNISYIRILNEIKLIFPESNNYTINDCIFVYLREISKKIEPVKKYKDINELTTKIKNSTSDYNKIHYNPQITESENKNNIFHEDMEQKSIFSNDSDEILRDIKDLSLQNNLINSVSNKPSELLLFGGVIKMDILNYTKIEMNLLPDYSTYWNNVIITFSCENYKNMILELNKIEFLKTMKILNNSEEIILNVNSFEFISDTEMEIKLLYATAII